MTWRGLHLHQQSWGCPEQALGGALLLHGLGEHSTRHAPLMERFAGHGIHVRGFDWPGHGHSDGQRGHLESIELIESLVQEQRQRLREAIGPSKPIGLLGHSMGGFFALYILLRHPDIARFAWIGSPLIDPEANASGFKRRLALFLNRHTPRFPIRSGIQFAQCRVGPRRRSDPLMHRRLTVRTGAVLLDTARAIQEHADAMNPDLCLLMTHGSADAVCSPELSREFFDRLPTQNKSYALLADALHEPFSGDSEDAFNAVIDHWVSDTLLPHLLQRSAPNTAI